MEISCADLHVLYIQVVAVCIDIKTTGAGDQMVGMATEYVPSLI